MWVALLATTVLAGSSLPLHAGDARPFLIDTDTASDDAVALVMALRHPEVDVEAITVVAGNVPLDKGVQNALYTVEISGSTVPVYAGVARPLVRKLETAESVHGEDGMGDIGLPLKGRQPEPGHAVEVIIETARRHAGRLTVVTLGPLTNLALALSRAPEIASQIERCVIMGGVGSGHGNVTPVAEYNIWVDPEAAHIVFGSGLPITMVGWDISRTSAVIDPATAKRLRGIDTDLARFVVDIQRALVEFTATVTKLDGFDLPDPIAMGVALDPGIAETRHTHVEVVIGDGPARGQTIVDYLPRAGRPPNVEVVSAVPREVFLAQLEAALR
jgi:purine nucleosidase